MAKLKRVKKDRARLPQFFWSPISDDPNRQKPRIAKMYIRMKNMQSTEATEKTVCPTALMRVYKREIRVSQIMAVFSIQGHALYMVMLNK